MKTSVGYGGRDIRFLGRAAPEDLPALYRLADLVGYPSLSEGSGVPPPGSDGVRDPVIASNRTSIPEVDNAALLVDPEDTAAMAEAMRRLVHDRVLSEELVQRGCRHAATFTWERTVKATLRVYDSLERH